MCINRAIRSIEHKEIIKKCVYVNVCVRKKTTKNAVMLASIETVKAIYVLHIAHRR